MSHDETPDPKDPYSTIELEVAVDGRTIPLNSFSRRSIARVVVALVSAYRGAERYRDRPPKKLEIRLS